MADGGFNFRQASGWVTDPANCTYVLRSDYNATTRGGFTFNWTSSTGIDDRNRITTYPRIGGLHFLDPASGIKTFQVTSGFTAGTYDIYLALGDANYTRNNMKVEFFDNTTSLFSFTGSTTGSNRFIDATEVARTAADWNSSNAPKTGQVFSSSTFKVTIGDGTNSCFLSHIRWTTSGGGGVFTPYWYRQHIAAGMHGESA